MCILIVIIFLALNIQDLKNINTNNKTNRNFYDFNTNFKENFLFELNFKINNCNIIHKDYKQYYHKFDGVKYPQYLYLSQNRKINYDCLNKSSPMKTILAWNKFYG